MKESIKLCILFLFEIISLFIYYIYLMSYLNKLERFYGFYNYFSEFKWKKKLEDTKLSKSEQENYYYEFQNIFGRLITKDEGAILGPIFYKFIATIIFIFLIIIYILYLSRTIKIKCQLLFIACISLVLFTYIFDIMKQKTESDVKIKEIYIFDEAFNKIIKESFDDLKKIKTYGIIQFISLLILVIATFYHLCFVKLEDKKPSSILVPQNNINQDNLTPPNNIENEYNYQNFNEPNINTIN